MSEIHYLNNSQISERIEGYKFSLPKFGESTTDPTYYEPTATRIANMKKSASQLKGVFDFEGKINGKTPEEIKNKSLQQLSDATVDVRFSKHGMTREEISQTYTEKALVAEDMINKKVKDKSDKKSRLEEEVAVATAVNESLAKQISDTPADTSAEQ